MSVSDDLVTGTAADRPVARTGDTSDASDTSGVSDASDTSEVSDAPDTPDAGVDPESADDSGDGPSRRGRSGRAGRAGRPDPDAQAGRPLGARLRARAASVTVPQALFAAAVLGYVWYFSVRSLNNHHALGTSTYDSALYDQGVWLLSRFEEPFVTLMGRNLFGDHTSFVLLFLVPIYWVFPGAGVLFIAQSVAIGAGAIPVFLYGRKRLGNEWYALFAAFAYLVHPAVGWTNLENFHPDGFLGAFVGFAIYAALERRWRMYAVFVVLSLLVKEDASLVVVPLGVWVALQRDRRRDGLDVRIELVNLERERVGYGEDDRLLDRRIAPARPRGRQDAGRVALEERPDGRAGRRPAPPGRQRGRARAP
ncbi:MAG: DUF2079 domain-containing protein, partial [Actinomycetota bacterium]